MAAYRAGSLTLLYKHHTLKKEGCAMKQFELIGKMIDRLSEIVAKAASWSIVVLVCTMTYEVIARYVAGKPTVWSYEMTYFLSSFMVIMAMAYTMKTRGHVCIDIIINRFSPRSRSVLYVVFALIFFFPMWILIIMDMIPHVIFSYNNDERSWVGSWLPPIWPFKLWILMGTILMLIQGVVEFGRDVICAVKGVDRL